MSKASKKYDELLDELKKVTITHYQIKKETEELKKIHKLQLTDLEAKLAESEKLKENYDILRCQHKSLGEFCDELKQQLAESERQYQEYRQIIEKDIEKEIDERMRDTIKEFNLDISQLKQQLAEKDVDLSLARNEINTLKHNLNVSQEHDNVMCEQYFNKCKETDQDKISFCIAKLEKVKNTIESKVESICKRLDDLNIKIVCESTSRELSACEEIIEEIDNQIEQLKKEQNNETR